MEEWKTYKLGSLCKKVCSGGTPKSTCDKYYGGGIPWLNTKEVDFNRIYSTESTISQVGLENSSAKWIDENSVIVAMYGNTAGKVALAKIPLTTNQACCNLMLDQNKADYRFIFYYLSSQYLTIKAMANGAAQQNLNAQQIKDIEVPLPSLRVQRQIADVLSSIDDKIELNNRINHNLEEQAQALYKSWFVDFEPFKGSKFVESEIGIIPESLKLCHISDISHVLETGRRPKGGVGELTYGIPSIGAESIKGLGHFDSSKVKFISEEFASTLKKGWINGYELLIYKDGGKPGYFVPNYNIFGEGFPYNRMCLNEHVFKLDFNDRGFNAFAYFYFHSDYVFNFLNAQGGKAAIPGINQNDIEAIWIFDTHNEYVKHFAERVSPVITTVLQNCRTNMKLSEIRDSILPNLMSGKLKINEIDC